MSGVTKMMSCIVRGLAVATFTLGVVSLAGCGSKSRDDESSGFVSLPTAPAPTATTPPAATPPAQVGATDSGAAEDAGTDAAPASEDAAAPSDDAASAATADAAPSGFDQFQQHNLADVNMYRATLGIAPLVLDTTLSAFALAGSVELSMDHTPHQHFINASNDGSIWTSGFNNAAAENQGDPNGWYVMAADATTNEMDQIDSIQTAMFDEGPGAGEAHGHYTNMMNPQYTRLGVGLLEVDGQLYLTNDFSN